MFWNNKMLMQAKDVFYIILAMVTLFATFKAGISKPILQEKRLIDCELSIRKLQVTNQATIPKVALLENDIGWIKRALLRIENKLDTLNP